MENRKDIPNVIAPPPLIFLSGLLIGGFIRWFSPAEFLPENLAVVSGIALLIAGLTIIVAAIFQMRRAKTNVEPWKPTTAILDTGLYAVSRNPIYLAMFFVYLGVSFLFNSIWFLPILPVVLLAVHYGVILREEKYLTRKFGDEYLNYKNRVRRWL
jgi:protein-S-isoprenylcysteine O-methyltransferase Ste14